MDRCHRILVIDDNPEIHQDFYKVLTARPRTADALVAAESVLFGATPSVVPGPGFTVDSANQGESGLAKVRQAMAEDQPYSIAFVDMRMPPGWDGLETIIRLMPEDPRLQLVICTAYSDHSWQELTDRVGATDRLLILKKPFDPIEILQLAHALTAKWEQARRAEGERERLETAVRARTAELVLANNVLNRSILELHTANNQLGRSETRFRAVVESAAAAIVIIDERGVIWMWNPGAERLFGWTAGEAMGRRIGEMMPGLAQLPDNAGGALDLPGVAKHGRHLELTVSRSRFSNDDGVFTSCIIQDIGPRKQAEAALIEARNTAEISTNAKSDFLAMVSHELRTPMNGIIGMNDLLLDSVLDAEQREFAETARTCASSLLGLLNGILDFSRLEAGRLDIQNIEFDLRGATGEVMDLLLPQARAKGLDLVLEVDATVPWQVLGDPGRFKQILVNLLGNAVKFTINGGVTVSLTLRGDAPDVLIVAVADSGIGIARDTQTRLFEPFNQVESPATRQYGGTGLGLAISHRLAGLMGGRIGLESELGKGSTFWCELPMPARPDPGDRAGRTSLAGMRIVYIDDNVGGRTAMTNQLMHCGASCEAVDGSATALERIAIAIAADAPYHVVLAEWRENGVDVLTLATKLRDEDGPPIVLLSRNARPGQGAVARAAGAAGLLTYPLAQNQLREALATVQDGGHIGTGMLTKHSIAEQRRRCHPWILLATSDIQLRRQALVRMAQLGCRTDVCAPDRLIEACSRHPYDMVVADPDAPGSPSLSQLRTALGTGHTPVVLALATADAEIPAGADGVLGKPLAPIAFETELLGRIPARGQRQGGGRDDGLEHIAAALDLELASASPSRLEEFDRTLLAATSAVMLAVARGDPAAICAAASLLDNRCRTAGVLSMAALAGEFERLGAANDVAGCAMAAGELHSRQRHVLAALQRLRAH